MSSQLQPDWTDRRAVGRIMISVDRPPVSVSCRTEPELYQHSPACWGFPGGGVDEVALRYTIGRRPFQYDFNLGERLRLHIRQP
jgi:hypothetical protein